jgi:hypothetical protein
MHSKWMAFLIAVLLAVTLYGCGSNTGSGGDSTSGPPEFGTDPITDKAYVGAAECIGCHDGFSWSTAVVASYLEGTHVVHSMNINAESDPTCLVCHDPIGDGFTLEDLIDPADLPAEGLAAIGCENCHGGGGDHFGVGPVPYPRPGPSICGQCHDALPQDEHLIYHPEGNNIFTNYQDSRHATARVRNEAVCSKCHTDEGGKLYKDVMTREAVDAVVLSVEDATAVQCRTCHNSHNVGKGEGTLLLGEGEDEDTGRDLSPLYNTCTTCHMKEYLPIDQTPYHDDRYFRIIADTHYDDPATPDKIEGYVLDSSDEHICLDCHDVHNVKEIKNSDELDSDDNPTEPTTTIQDQWAKSGHAGKIGVVKFAAADTRRVIPEGDPLWNRTVEQTIAVKEAGVEEETGPAWVFYPWTTDERADCVQCHTATGGATYLDYLTTPGNAPGDFEPTAIPDPDNPGQTYSLYDKNGKFPHIIMDREWDDVEEEWVYSKLQKELLYCWGCHSNNAGGLRNPGATTLSYEVDGVNPTVRDLGKTNVCVSCHAGRGNMDSLVTVATADPSNDAPDKTATATHYFNAAATIYQAQLRPGYEYPGRDYSDSVADPPYLHDDIGLNSDIPETGSGPCSGCHMGSDEAHTFAVVEKDGSGVITGVSAKAACDVCHTPGESYEITAASLEHEAEGYHQALEILDTLFLTIKNFGFDPTYPYFFKDNNPEDDEITANEAIFPNRVELSAEWGNEGTIGAAHNYNYLYHEPGAYAHNRYYAKRLIFDSIDWIDNGALGGTIIIDVDTYPEAATWFGWEGDPATGNYTASRP